MASKSIKATMLVSPYLYLGCTLLRLIANELTGKGQWPADIAVLTELLIVEICQYVSWSFRTMYEFMKYKPSFLRTTQEVHTMLEGG